MEQNFLIQQDTLCRYKGTDAIVTIPDSVRCIGEKAFRGCDTVTDIIVPDSVISIQWGAFSFCENLESLTLPASVQLISISAIEGCKKLQTIRMDENNKDYCVKGNQIISKRDQTYIISTDILK